MFSFLKSKRKKNTDNTTSNSRYGEIIIKKIQLLTPDSKALHFELPSNMSYLSGQFITLIFDIDGKSYRRAYSFSSSPSENMAAIGVKRVPNGKISTHIFNNIKEGDSIKIMQPAGRFILDEKFSDYFLIAGGSGITPILSMVKVLSENSPSKKIHLIYANNDETSIMFKDELNDLIQKNNNLRVIHVLKDTPDHKYQGFLSHDLLNRIYQDTEYNADVITNKSTEIGCFICGPGPLLNIVKSYYATLELPNVFYESFNNDEQKNTQKENTIPESNSKKTHAVKIELNGETLTLDVPEGKKILETALENDIDLPFSCQSGVCEACRGKCLSGQIEMEEHDGLTASEIKEGYILTCVSHPKSDNVHISIE